MARMMGWALAPLISGGLFGKLFGKKEENAGRAAQTPGDARPAVATIIHSCWKKLDDNLTGKGYHRVGSETVRQYLKRVEEHLSIDKGALYELMGLVELARYSDFALTEYERDRALAALRDIEQSQQTGSTTGVPRPVPKSFPPANFRPWVTAPIALDAHVYEKLPPDMVHRPLERLTADRDALAVSYRTKTVPPGSGISAQTAEMMRDCIRTEDFTGLDRFLKELMKGPEGQWRVYADMAMPTYLLELGYRLGETCVSVDVVPRVAQEVAMKGACLLAIAEGRSFMIPDDIKLALLASQVIDYNLKPGDANATLDTTPVPWI